ncbi:MAG: hypothetical protein JO246_03540 [Frankiaceae bacterium]|nr:hypothetical protein [Frankiaceae bacterium]MBV9872502.1 hypothetical protein [Frankiaceae bacterium]
MRRARLSRTAGLAVLATALGVTTLSGQASARPASHAVACSQAAVQKALSAGGTYVFGADCHLQLTETLTVSPGRTVSLDGNGHNVVLDGLGPDNVTRTRILALSARDVLFLHNLVLTNGLAQGRPGSDGHSRYVGEAGGEGQSGRGGAIYNPKFSTVVLDYVNVIHSTAIGGDGGDGGNGGDGQDAPPTSNPGLVNGADGGPGGTGGIAGGAYGGGVYSRGTLVVVGGTFIGNIAQAGAEGDGGAGGAGGDGATLHCGPNCTSPGGNGGQGGAAGKAYKIFNYALAEGGAIYSNGYFSIRDATLTDNHAIGTRPGEGGDGGDGGASGCSTATTSICGTPGDGGRGGNGGYGDLAAGGAYFANGYSAEAQSAFTTNSADAGQVASDCSAGGTGCGGRGGAGASAGDDGTVGGSGVSRDADGRTARAIRPVKIGRNASAGAVRRHHHLRRSLSRLVEGGVGPLTYKCAKLPRGLKCTKDGFLTGRPRKAGDVTFVLTVTDTWAAVPNTAKRHVLLVVKH